MLISHILALAPVMAVGSTNPAVTQENIYQTICVKGWTQTIRPPASYTTKLKIQQLRAQGLRGAASDYEEDHMISLELGGHPTDVANLWPEPWDGPNGAHAKDRVENRLNREVCAGRMSLSTAQRLIVQWAHEHPPIDPEQNSGK